MRPPSWTLFSITLVASGLAVAGCSDKSRNHAYTASSTAASTSGTSTAPTQSSTGGPTIAPSAPPPTPTGSGVFVDASAALPASTANDWDVAAGDLDRDGRVDLVFAVYGAAPRVLLGRASGGFAAASGAMPAIAPNAADVQLADLDGDQDLDVVLGCLFTPVQILLNDGAARFTVAGSYPAANPTYTYEVAVADVDGDGDPDLLMANAGQQTATRGANVLLINDGAGGFTEATSALPPQTEDSVGAVFVDVNGDQRPDLYVVNFGVADRLLINDGAGRFRDETSARLPAGLATAGTAVVALDVDADGFVDLFVTNEGLPQNGNPPPGEADTLLLNDGTGRFRDASTLLPSFADASFDARAADVDGDGWTDLICATLRAPNRLYLNKQGVFVDATASLPAANQPASDSLGLEVADVDGDKTLDLVFPRRREQPLVFTNRPK